MGTIKVGFLHSLVRKEEKLLITEFNKRADVELVMLDDRELKFDLETRWKAYSRSLQGLLAALVDNAERLVRWRYMSWS